jgi:hypothetical protein
MSVTGAGVSPPVEHDWTVDLSGKTD